MPSSEVQQALSTNGHLHAANDQDTSHLEHEDSTGPSRVDPADRPEQDIPEAGLEGAGTAQHEQLRSGSAQPEETAASPVLDKPSPAVQSAASSKQKPTTSSSKHPTPTVQTTTTKGVAGPPTPQVKKVFTHSLRFVTCKPTLVTSF
jgi:hypothetical protein